MFLFSDKFVSRPYFGDTETVITVQQGEAAFFNCQVFNLANQTVRYHPQSSLFKTYSRPPEKWFTQHCFKGPACLQFPFEQNAELNLSRSLLLSIAVFTRMINHFSQSKVIYRNRSTEFVLHWINPPINLTCPLFKIATWLLNK